MILTTVVRKDIARSVKSRFARSSIISYMASARKEGKEGCRNSVEIAAGLLRGWSLRVYVLERVHEGAG